MKNKVGVILLTIVISLLCVYYLSFSFISKNIYKEATVYATAENGTLDFTKRQQFLDSVWREPVYNLFGISYTYQDIKETELNLGLDLQGGMHVTLEVSPIDIIKGRSGNNDDPAFVDALAKARQKQFSQPQAGFVNLFYESYQENAPGQSLANIFANAANRGTISLQSTDDEILDIINTDVEEAIGRSFNILRTRIDRFGTSQPNIQRLQGSGLIQIELPGVDNPERVRRLLQGVAKLEFWEVHEFGEIIGTIQTIDQLIVQQQQNDFDLGETGEQSTAASASSDLGDLLTADESDTIGDVDDLQAQLEGDTSKLDSLIAPPQSSPLFSLIRQGYGTMVYDTKDTAQINRLLSRTDVKALITSNIKFLWAVKPIDDNNELTDDEPLELYAIKTNRGDKAPLTGEAITDARQELDDTARPAIGMQMNANGAKVWKRLTGDNINRRIAIVLDNYVYSAPNVISEIPSGRSQISGSFTLEEAKDLANALKAGTLPVKTTIVEDVVIGPTLGQEAQRQGIISILAGLGIVVIFMVFYYSGGGFVANLALAFNVFFILGILAQLASSLTLPGIAGIVLTIGMSIDANVLIFERIKEEIRKGAGLKIAIANGYNKAYSSIVDANLTTFLTGIILYVLGQGPVKGFAITLMIGIACSFFSAVFITRVVIEWLTRKGDQSKISFSFPFTANVLTNLNYKFMEARKKAYIFSASFIIIGMVTLYINGGLTMGVDFTGGRAYVVSFNDPIVPSQLKTSLQQTFDNAGTEVKTFGANNVMKITTSYMIQDESDNADDQVRDKLIAGLGEFTGQQYVEDDSKVDASHFTISSSSKVGASIADDIKRASFLSILFALIVIFLYILVRFRKWQFSLGAIIALAHDTLFVLGAFAIMDAFGISYEFDQIIVGAMLMIIGYSINDTVVVFDRIRETLGLKSSSDVISVFNESLNQTLSRTMITSATTLFVVVILFLFGGAVLEGFSFALIVGILIGTYSSIFIATPIVLDFDKKRSFDKKPQIAAKAV
ncbi:MAG: protein translocase subunit SecDF [Bacteroidetes bacterium]|nr:protein translocase subunit SecDF [Bacteroidota bacterium]